MRERNERSSLLWAKRDGTISRVWITPRVSARSAGGAVGPAIHFADPEWKEVGTAPVEPEVELWHLTSDELEALFQRATERT